MKINNNRIIHRFIKDRSEYEEGGSLFTQIIPVGVQAYSYELKENGDPTKPDDYIVRYVLGTGSSTYMEIANGLGKDEDGNPLPELSREYMVTSLSQIEWIIENAVKEKFDSKVTHLTELTEEYASENLGEIVQYIGDETGDYLTGYFYQACEEIIIDEETGEETIRYYWERVSVQPETDLKPIEERVDALEKGKVDKTTEPNRIYGTDGDGGQTTYDKEDFGKVDDVRLLNITTGEYESVVEEKIAKLAPGAIDIAYTNDQYPAMQTLQDAMDKLLYIEPSVSISGGGTYEKGSSVSSVNLRWTWNKKVVSQSLNQGIGALDPTLRAYAYTPETPITVNTTFTITGNDGTKDKSASTTVSFSQKRYWGVSANTSLTDAEIRALSQEFSSSRAQTRTFNCSGGKYFYFAIKTSYCNGIGFKVGGLSFSDMLVETRQFENASGFTDSYNIYRVNNIQTGAAIVVEVL